MSTIGSKTEDSPERNNFNEEDSDDDEIFGRGIPREESSFHTARPGLCAEPREKNISQDDSNECTTATEQYLVRIHALASEFLKNGENEQALKLFEQILKTHMKMHGESHPLVGSTWHNIGIVHARSGRSDLAFPAFRNAVQITKESVDANHPSVSTSLVQIGFLHLIEKNYEDAVLVFSQALEIRIRSFGVYHPLVAKIHINLAVTNIHMGNRREAKAEFDEALMVQRQVLKKMCEDDESSESGEDKVVEIKMAISSTLCNLGSMLLEDDPDKLCADEDFSRNAKVAERSFAEALSIQSAILGENNCNVSRTRVNLVTARDRLKRSQLKVRSCSPIDETNACTNSFCTVTNMDAISPRETFNTNKFDHSRDGFPRSTSVKMPKMTSTGTGSHKRAHSSPLPQIPITMGKSKGDVPSVMACSSLGSDFSSVPSNISGDHAYGDDVNEDDTVFSNGCGITAIRTLEGCSDAEEDFSNNDVNGKQQFIPIITQEMLSCPDEHVLEIQKAAEINLKRNAFNKALNMYEHLLQYYHGKFGESHHIVGSALHSIGMIYLKAGDFEEALEAFQNAVRNSKNALGEDHPDVSVSVMKVGLVQLNLRQFDDALLSFKLALAMRRKNLGKTHILTAKVLNNIGCVYAEQKDFTRSLYAFEKALDTERSALVENPTENTIRFSMVTSLCNLGFLYRRRGMYEKCAIVLREALSIQETLFESHHPSILSTLYTLADAESMRHEHSTALGLYTKIISVLSFDNEEKNEEHRAVVFTRVGNIHIRQQDYEPALLNLQQALSIRNDRLRRREMQRVSNQVSKKEVEISIRLRAQIDQLEKMMSEDVAIRKTLDWF